MGLQTPLPPKRLTASFTDSNGGDVSISALKQFFSPAFSEPGVALVAELTLELGSFWKLSIQQLYRISTMHWDDKYGTQSVFLDVLSSMRVLMTEDSNNSVSKPFLLDDDSSIPFSVDDISKSVQQISIADIDPPPPIRANTTGLCFYYNTQRKI